MRACMRDVFAIYDNKILPRLIMIIIKIIILYFIQIRHTDDFPSTGTRLVNLTTIRAVCKCVLTNMSVSCLAAAIPLQSSRKVVYA